MNINMILWLWLYRTWYLLNNYVMIKIILFAYECIELIPDLACSCYTYTYIIPGCSLPGLPPLPGHSYNTYTWPCFLPIPACLPVASLRPCLAQGTTYVFVYLDAVCLAHHLYLVTHTTPIPGLASCLQRYTYLTPAGRDITSKQPTLISACRAMEHFLIRKCKVRS